MEGFNSYIVLSVNGDESVHLIPELISGSLPNLYVAETSGQKILTNMRLLPLQNSGDNLNTNNENSILGQRTVLSDKLELNSLPEESINIIKCSECGDTFNDINSFAVHEKTHQRQSQWKCIRCKKTFTKVNSYKKHLWTHIDDKLFSCVSCNAGFNFENNYRVHMALHGSSLVCPICGLSFHRKASLKSHLALHQVEEFYTCPECSSEFENLVDLRKHIKNHTLPVKNKSIGLICNYCKVRFESTILLKQHIACHIKVKKLVLNGRKAKKEHKKQGTQEKKHECKVCGKTFPKFSLLKRHVRIHNGERPYVCQICSKGFSQKGTLQIHLSKHSGIKPFCCTLCPAKFYQRSNLKVHVQKTHTAVSEGEKSFKCSECHCIFKRVASLNGHMAKFHAGSSPITITTVIDQLKSLEKQLGGNTVDSEKDHFTENTSNSSVLDQNDISKENANVNCKVYSLLQKSDGQHKVYVCSYCKKESKKPSDLIRHLRTHTKEKPFKCQCGMSFAIKSTLKSHMQTHRGKKCPNCSKIIFSPKVWKAHLRKHKTISIGKNDSEEEFQDVAAHCKSSSKQKKVISDKPLKCQLCPSSYLRKMSLKRHMRLHTGESTSKCDICSRLFVSDHTLKEHMKCHMNTKNFSCDLCDTKFMKQSLLNRHISTCHDDTKPYECPYCRKRFKKLIMCRKHIDTHEDFNEVQTKEQDNVRVDEKNIPTSNSSDNPIQKTTILRVDTNGVVFDHPFDSQPDNNSISNAVLETVETINEPTTIVNSGPILDSKQSNSLQNILISCPEMQTGEVLNHYILSQLELQPNDTILLNAVDVANEQPSIVLNVQNLNIDAIPHVENVITEEGYPDDLGEKSTDPVFSFAESNIPSKKSQIICHSVDNPESCVQNDIGDNFLSNNISLYPNTRINFDVPLEHNTNSINVIQSQSDEFVEVLNEADSNADCNSQLFDTQETVNLNMIHCLACKQMFDTMETYQRHVCSKSILKKVDIPTPCEEIDEVVYKKCDTDDTGDEDNKNLKKSAKKFLSCVYCSKEFSNRTVYRKHVNSHQKKGLHVCKYCEKEFKKPSDLGRHLRTHTGERPFACDQCDKKFSLKSTLEVHCRTHDPSAAKNFVCEVCNSSFSSRSSKKLHMYVHTGTKPHKCTFCDQYFRTTAHRRSHEKTMHLSKQDKILNQSKAKKITNILAAAVDMAVNGVANDNKSLEPHDTSRFSEIEVELADSSDSIQIDHTLLQHLQNSNIFLQEIDHEVLACSESVDNLVDMEARDIISSEYLEENAVSNNHISGNLAYHEECSTPDDQHENLLQFHLKNFSCAQCESLFSTVEELNEHKQTHIPNESYSCFLCDIRLVGDQQLKSHLRSVHAIAETSSQIIL